jgi:hypothetical protein
LFSWGGERYLIAARANADDPAAHTASAVVGPLQAAKRIAGIAGEVFGFDGGKSADALRFFRVPACAVGGPPCGVHYAGFCRSDSACIKSPEKSLLCHGCSNSLFA